MQTEDFLRLVMPEHGVLCVATPAETDDGRKYYRHATCTSVQRMAELAEQLNNKQRNALLPMASYAEERTFDPKQNRRRFIRRNENVLHLRSLWFDLDIGDSPSKHQSKKEAYLAMRAFVAKHSLPLPITVDSGGGLHLYWPLDADMTVALWRKAARIFYVAGTRAGLKIDPQCTNPSSGLRIPGSLNYKYSPPRPVVIKQIPYEGVQIPAQWMMDKIREMMAGIPIDELRSTSSERRQVSEDSEAIAQAEEAKARRDANNIISQCEQIRTCGTAMEPVWRAGLSVLRLCSNGYEVAHRVSQEDERYDASATNAKLELLADQQGTVGAAVYCQTFNSLRPGVCAGCPHWGKVLRGEMRTPLTLADRPPLAPAEAPPVPTELLALLTAPPAPPAVSSSSLGVTQIPAESTTLLPPPLIQAEPEPPSPHINGFTLPAVVEQALAGKMVSGQGANFICITPEVATHPELVGTVKIWFEDETYTTETGETKKRQVEKRKYISCDTVVPISRYTKKNDRRQDMHATYWRISKRGVGHVQDIAMDNCDTHSDNLMKFLAGAGAVVDNSSDFKSFGDCTRAMLAEAGRVYPQAEIFRHFGWVDPDKTVFAWGTRVYKSGEGNKVEVTEVPPNQDIAIIADMLTTSGTIEPWKQAYSIFGRPGLEHQAFFSFSTWGAPLMALTPQAAITVLAYSPESGIGKTTCMRVAQAVWGNPTMLKTLATGTDTGGTMNSFMSRMKQTHNLPSGLDEITMLPTDKVSELIYTLAEGRERERATRDGMSIRQPGEWQCIHMATSNTSLRNKLAQGSDPYYGARLMRLYEIYFPGKGDDTSFEDRATFDQVGHTNYGHAADRYIKFMIANRKRLPEYISKKYEELAKMINGTQAERIWLYGAACMFVGAALAKAAGLHDIDIDRVQRWWAYHLIPDQRGELERTRVNGEELLAQFFADNQRNTLVVQAHRAPAYRGTPEDKLLDDKLAQEYVTRDLPPGGQLYVRAEQKEGRAFISYAALTHWCTRREVPMREMIGALKRDGLLQKELVRTVLGRGVPRLMTSSGASSKCIQVFVKEMTFDDEEGDEDYDT